MERHREVIGRSSHLAVLSSSLSLKKTCEHEFERLLRLNEPFSTTLPSDTPLSVTSSVHPAGSWR